MKSILYHILLLLGIIYSTIVFAQSVPQGINYQAVARDANGNELVNQALDVKLAIKSKSGSIYNTQWEETQQITTNEYGLFTLVIGSGTSTGNGSQTSFSNVPWSSYDMYLNVSIDDGNGYIDLGKTQLVSVPYALVAGSSNAWGLTGNGDINTTTDYIGTSDAKDFIFKTQAIERLRISSAGNIAIGTTAPTARLHINSVFSPEAVKVQVNGNTKLWLLSNGGLSIGEDNKAVAANGLLVSGNVTLGTDTINTAYVKYNPKLLVNSDQGCGIKISDENSSTSFGIHSYAASSGSSSNSYGIYGWANGIYRNYGVLGLATNPGSGTTNYGVYGNGTDYGVYGYGNYGVYADGSYYGLYASVSSSTGFAVYADGPTFSTGGYQSSDMKLKKNINSMDNALDKLMLLSPKTYEYKNDEYASMHLPRGTQMGFIAQDIEEIFPEIVMENIFPGKTDEQGRTISEKVEFKCMNYTALIPLLTKAIQEQQELINTQNELNKTQQQQIDEQNQRINKLENMLELITKK